MPKVVDFRSPITPNSLDGKKNTNDSSGSLLISLTSVDTHAGAIAGEVRFADAPPKLPLVKVSEDKITAARHCRTRRI